MVALRTPRRPLLGRLAAAARRGAAGTLARIPPRLVFAARPPRPRATPAPPHARARDRASPSPLPARRGQVWPGPVARDSALR